MRRFPLCVSLSLPLFFACKEGAITPPVEDLGQALVAALQPEAAGRSPDVEQVDCSPELPGREAIPSPPPAGSLRSLEMVTAHPREPSGRAPAWRMRVDSAKGPGTILRVDLPAGDCYVGRGVFQGWPQSNLRRTYRHFSPEKTTAEVFQQLD